MQYAKTLDGARMEAAKGVRARCPSCGMHVIPKCGRIKVHHWAHEAGYDCDAWYEPETEWHRTWKNLFPTDQCEVAMGEHRADIRTPKGLVIELQNSAIAPEEIEIREHFYRNMIWIVNAEKFAGSFFLMKLMDAQRHVFSFKWKHRKPSWTFARRPVYFDFGPNCLSSLLGAEEREPSDRFVTGGFPSQFEKRKIVRYCPSRPGRVLVDEQLSQLPADVLTRSVLLKQTLYDNGRGSVRAFSRAELLRICGL
ncbi:MAG: competence protein CoiA [Fimbriimonas sp.]